MKVLLIGGTETISSAIFQRLLEEGHELWLINRGNHRDTMLKKAHVIWTDIENEAYDCNPVGSACGGKKRAEG